MPSAVAAGSAKTSVVPLLTALCSPAGSEDAGSSDFLSLVSNTAVAWLLFAATRQCALSSSHSSERNGPQPGLPAPATPQLALAYVPCDAAEECPSDSKQRPAPQTNFPLPGGEGEGGAGAAAQESC